MGLKGNAEFEEFKKRSDKIDDKYKKTIIVVVMCILYANSSCCRTYTNRSKGFW